MVNKRQLKIGGLYRITYQTYLNISHEKLKTLDKDSVVMITSMRDSRVFTNSSLIFLLSGKDYGYVYCHEDEFLYMEEVQYD